MSCWHSPPVRALLALSLLALPAAAQPWRYTDDRGQVHWTNDVHQLPPHLRARVLAKRKAAEEARQAAEEAKGEAEEAPPKKAEDDPALKATRLGRGVFDSEQAASPPPKKTPPAAPRADPTQQRLARLRDEVGKLRAALVGANADLQAARMAAINVPDGRNYARRNEAEARVR